jgi:hypothetical protein
MVSRPVLQSATKMADNKGGGQALDLLTTALKTDSNIPMHREPCKTPKILDYTAILLHSN